MTLLLTHSTETLLPETPLPLHRYLTFTLTQGDARWRLFAIGGAVNPGVQLLQTFLPEEKHLGVAVLQKLLVLYRLECNLLGASPWAFQ